MDHEDLTRRLRALGDPAIPDETRDAHLRRMAATPSQPGRRGPGRLWVAAAAAVGFLVGSTGLAAADALPGPAQDVAHDVLAVVQIDVPEGTRGACVSSIAKSDLSKAEKKSAKAACPKGGPPSGTEDDDGPERGDVDGDGTPGRSGQAPGQTKHADDPCRGKPPWAGRPDLTKDEKAALKAEIAAACGREAPAPDDQDDDEDEMEDDEGAETGSG